MTPVDTASGGFPFPILPAIVLVPAIAATVLFLLPRAEAGVARTVGRVVGWGGALITTGLALAMAVRFRTGTSGYQFVTAHQWMSTFGVQWKFGVDGISVFLVAATAVLFAVTVVGTRVGDGNNQYLAWLLLLETGCLGAFLSLDMLLFFLFFELTLPPMYFLIARWGGPNRSYAALRFFIYTFAGSGLMFIALLALVFLEERSTGHLTFDVLSLTANQHLSSGVGMVLFLGFAAAFAVKVPIFPFHTWLPDAQEIGRAHV